MKRSIILSFLISILILGNTIHIRAQEMTKQDYLELSKKQKKTGLILVGGGAVSWVLGAAIGSDCFECTGGTVGGVMTVVGGLAVLVGIPTLLISGSNAKKARQLSLINQPLYPPVSSGQIPRSYPALRISISLN